MSGFHGPRIVSGDSHQAACRPGCGPCSMCGQACNNQASRQNTGLDEVDFHFVVRQPTDDRPLAVVHCCAGCFALA